MANSLDSCWGSQKGFVKGHCWGSHLEGKLEVLMGALTETGTGEHLAKSLVES